MGYYEKQKKTGTKAQIKFKDTAVANVTGLNTKRIQPKLKIGRSGDRFEKEADNIAAKVTRTGNNIQMSGGSVQNAVESVTGSKLGNVNIHTDAGSVQANKELGSKAFTYGNNIYMGQTSINNSSADRGLLAHEMAHVAQQNTAGSMIQGFGLGQHRQITKVISEGAYGMEPEQKELDEKKVLLAELKQEFIEKYGEEYDVYMVAETGEKADAAERILMLETEINVLTGEIARAQAAIKEMSTPSKKGKKSNIVKGNIWNDIQGNTNTGSFVKSFMKKGSQTDASHHGKLSFLHAQRENAEEDIADTREAIIQWGIFCYKVYTGEYKATDKIGQVQEGVIKERFDSEAFKYGEKRIGDIFLVGDKYRVRKKQKKQGEDFQYDTGKLKSMAMGSLTHVLQDSYASSHAARAAGVKETKVFEGIPVQLRPIKNFSVYGDQSSFIIGGRHGRGDKLADGKGGTSSEKRKDKVSKTVFGDDIVSVGTVIIKMFAKQRGVEKIREFMEYVLTLDENITKNLDTATGGDKKGIAPANRLFKARNKDLHKLYSKLDKKIKKGFSKDLENDIKKYDYIQGAERANVENAMDSENKLNIFSHQYVRLMRIMEEIKSGNDKGLRRMWNECVYDARDLYIDIESLCNELINLEGNEENTNRLKKYGAGVKKGLYSKGNPFDKKIKTV